MPCSLWEQGNFFTLESIIIIEKSVVRKSRAEREKRAVIGRYKEAGISYFGA